jgi:hypothetical protein
VKWRLESHQGLDVWMRDLKNPPFESERLSLVVWQDSKQGDWEWELIGLVTDRTFAGATAENRHSAILDAEAVARLFGLT